MNNSLKKSETQPSPKQLRSLQQWEQIRAKGKARFIIQSALTSGLTMIGVTDVVDHVLGNGHYSISLSWMIGYLLVGFVGAFAGWNGMEATYKNALIEARVNAAPSGALAPHTNVLQLSPNEKDVREESVAINLK